MTAATHIRTQLRAAIASRLSGLGTTKTSVYTTQLYPLPSSALPALLVVTGPERITNASIGFPPLLARELEVVIVALVASASGAEDMLDAIAAEVEAAVAQDRTFGGLVRDLQLNSMQPSFDTDGSPAAARLEIRYWATYRAREGEPTIPM